MNRISVILVSAFMLLFSAANAQTEKFAPAPVKEVKMGTHGGLLVTEGSTTMEYLQKKGALIVFPSENPDVTNEMSPAKFTIVDNGKTIVVENVAFKNGMYAAEVAQELVNPIVKFEARINGKSTVMNFEMPSK